MFDYSIIQRLLEERATEAKELASFVGVSPSVLSDWGSGRLKPPSVDKIERVADFFDVSVDYLLGRTNQLTVIASQDDVINKAKKEQGQMSSEGKDMIEKARDNLKKLVPIFRYIENFDKRDCERDDEKETDIALLLGNADLTFINCRKIFSRMLQEWNVNKASLREWTVSNFMESPTERQLRYMLEFIKQTKENAVRFYRGRLSENYYLKGNYDDFEEAINDYVYYASKKSYEGFDQDEAANT